MNTTVKFHTHILNNTEQRSENLIDSYYQDNVTDENKKTLKNLCLYEKALICFDEHNYKKSIIYYKQLFSENLLKNELEKSMTNLFICQNYIRLGNKKQATELINKYFEKNNKYYDLDFLICYAQITDKKIMSDFHLNIAKKGLSELGYKDEFPKSYQDLIVVHDLYTKKETEN